MDPNGKENLRSFGAGTLPTNSHVSEDRCRCSRKCSDSCYFKSSSKVVTSQSDEQPLSLVDDIISVGATALASIGANAEEDDGETSIGPPTHAPPTPIQRLQQQREECLIRM